MSKLNPKETLECFFLAPGGPVVTHPTRIGGYIGDGGAGELQKKWVQKGKCKSFFNNFPARRDPKVPGYPPPPPEGGGGLGETTHPPLPCPLGPTSLEKKSKNLPPKKITQN